MLYSYSYDPSHNEIGVGYGIYIQADNFKNAEQIADSYNLTWVRRSEFVANRTFFPVRGISNLIRAGLYEAAIHEACFLGYIALKAKLASLEEIIGDDGLVHHLAHILDEVYCTDRTKNSRKCMKHELEQIGKLADEIEQRIPGYPDRPTYERFMERELNAVV